MVDSSPLAYTAFDHDAYARSLPRDDFLGQIRRTVDGNPVSEEQMQLIEDTIVEMLQLDTTDRVLDLACGNGILSRRLFDKCCKLFGVDLSEFLISVAKEYFEKIPEYRFSQRDIVDFLRVDSECLTFNKAFCYGSFSYLSEPSARESLNLLYTRFPEISVFYIGNLPDYDRRDAFFTRSKPSEDDLRLHTTSIGIWRSEQEFCDLSRACGWRPFVHRMNDKFYSSSYRYDVLLKRDN